MNNQLQDTEKYWKGYA